MSSLVAGMFIAGRYALERRFASGAWGSLWHAHDEKSHSNCAVRLTGAGVVDVDAVRERFARGLRAAHALRCENVVNVLDHGEWDGTPFVVFESLSGEDLAAKLRREGRLQPGQVIQVVTDVARALTRAHELGVIHGDLKPENIFLSRVGSHEVAKVLDFGITGGGPGASLETKVGQLGELLYASPEQALAGNLDFRSDTWSLAAIAFHCLVGRPPFESDTLPALLTGIASAPVPSVAELDPELPVTVDAWRENALSRDPVLRFQSAEELAAELARALQGVALTGRPPRARPPGARRAAHAADSVGPSWLPVSLGAVFGLLLVTLGVALVRNNPTPPPTAELSLPRRQEPAHSIDTPAPSTERTASAPPPDPLPCQAVVPLETSGGIAPREAFELSSPRARTKRTKPKNGRTLLDRKGEPDYGI